MSKLKKMEKLERKLNAIRWWDKRGLIVLRSLIGLFATTTILTVILNMPIIALCTLYLAVGSFTWSILHTMGLEDKRKRKTKAILKELKGLGWTKEEDIKCIDKQIELTTQEMETVAKHLDCKKRLIRELIKKKNKILKPSNQYLNMENLQDVDYDDLCQY